MYTVFFAGDGVEVAKTAVDAVITAMSDVFTLSGNIITRSRIFFGSTLGGFIYD